MSTASGKSSKVRLVQALVLLLILTGCNTANHQEQSNNSSIKSNEGRPQKLTLMLDWYPNAVHSFLYAAQLQGYFAEEGLDVEIRMPADSTDALRLVAAGQVDLAMTYQPQVLMARNEQIPVKSIAEVVRQPLNHFIVRADGVIQRPRDLEGKTVGYSSIPLYEAMIRSMVKQDGGNADAMKLVDVGYNLIPALSTGQVDGIIGGFINHEALLLERDGYPVLTFNPVDYGVPEYAELVLVASEEGLLKSKEAFTKFIHAVQKGQKYVQEHPAEALKNLLDQEEETSPLDPVIEEQSLQILLPLMEAGSQPFGYQEPESWNDVRVWLEKNKMIAPGLNAADAYINL